MSWLLQLYKTYEANLDQVGIIEKKANDKEYTLLPVAHTTQNAHIEVNITEDGNFHSAFVIDKINTVIPSTEESASRAGSKIAPYPLHDKLSYVAGDFVAYGGKVKKEEPFTYYIEQLENWALSPYSNDKVKSIYSYLKKQQLIKDLVKENILYLDKDEKLIEAWDKKYESLHGDKPAIFSVITGGQESAFIRFNVHSSTRLLEKVWNDTAMYDSFIKYYNNLLGGEDLCFVTGQKLPSTEKHANKIRNAGDKAKLISANDKAGFTYRGRFNKSIEAASISYEVSQKAHNALKWLINRQGKAIDNRVFLVWGNEGSPLPSPIEDTFDISRMMPGLSGEPTQTLFTNKEFSREFAKALDGYKNDLSTQADVNILILDSATTGRLAVLYYRNFNKEIYLDRLKKWHSTCVWHHGYKKGTSFIGAPATKDIAYAAYGPRANEKIVKGLMERLLPCIVDDKRTPKDIVKSCLQRASNPASMEKWEWEKTLSVACAVINREEGFEVALDKESKDRDYLFGRLLAVADVLERRALGSEETRSTNAIRYMNGFSKHPARTWKTIQDSLQPYQARLGTNGLYLTKLMDEIASKIELDDFNNKPLSGKYLLGLYSQRHELYQKKEAKEPVEENSK
ncbi:type I-C CRISPR-associated protein Cas8c/Csd1 [Aquibacillus salsiterrae]|uniref:Type I-C CRISPR-associated protein Cas8c/Csd1 n=1 Tax=Aquibacillus salsiterrae TaxID=2950439 RepID=A0A9X4AFC2_9BACI|nr:type I-C CRISPR-associated protein Cas8c/Csd1 [Aquibacillus salsiterrae]MDC3415898.1 type I-C CRISPR-associated protein Cas8c/Csd1 [Aquibacillus salsiterrae]